MTVFFLISILVSTIFILISLQQEKWFLENKSFIFIVTGFYMFFSIIRFIVLDDYTDSREYMLFFLLTLVIIEMIYDLVTHQIVIEPILIMLPLISVYNLVFYQGIEYIDIVAVILIVGCAGLVKRFLSHVIGYGDVLMCGLVVSWTGFSVAMLLIVTGFILNGIICVGLFAFKRVDKKTQIPFMPAMTLSLILYLVGGVIVL